MSLEHKAYLFDHQAFFSELRPLIENALRTENSQELIRFIDDNRAALKDPYEGNPLSSDWISMIEFESPDQYADFALTKYYDPSSDIGLGSGWQEVSQWLATHASAGRDPTLGSPIAVEWRYFDPGKMGSYFESHKGVQHKLEDIRKLLEANPGASILLTPLIELLSKASQKGAGLYITF